MPRLRLLGILAIIAIGVAYVLLMLPFLQASTDFAALPPPVQYLLFNLGFYFLFSGILGVVIATALGRKRGLREILVAGLGTFILFSFVLDLYQPPLAVSPDGTLAMAESGSLIGTSVDYMVAWSWQNGLGIGGPLLYYMTYIVTPIIAVLASVLIFGGKRFLRLYEGAI